MLEPLIKFGLLFLNFLFELLIWCIFISVLMSWFATGRTKFGIFIEQIVRPMYKPFRWARIGMLDLSPILAFFVLRLIVDTLNRVLYQFL